MDWQKLLLFLKKGENPHINFISSITSEDDIGPSLVALANTEGGGHIFVGVDIINYHLKGTEIDDKFINDLIEKFCTPIFYATSKIIERNSRKILMISVADGNNKPYSFKKKCFIRDHKDTRLATKEEERSLQEKKSLMKILNPPNKEDLLTKKIADTNLPPTKIEALNSNNQLKQTATPKKKLVRPKRKNRK